jgi:predicted helicase
MASPFSAYRASIQKQFDLGKTSEGPYYPALENLLNDLGQPIGLVASLLGSHVRDCGIPDFHISHQSDTTTTGYVEAKPIGTDLDDIEQRDQLQRYLSGFGNLVLTNYTEFRWYVRGEPRGRAILCAPSRGRLAPNPSGDREVASLLDGFLHHEPEPIVDASALASHMARLTHLIRETIVNAFTGGNASETLSDLHRAFGKVLIPNLPVTKFADMYAQTIAYGLFAARINHASEEPFRRDHAQHEIPQANPFIRRLFGSVVAPTIEDEPYLGLVDDLAQLFASTDVDAVMASFGQCGHRDPIFHFYETFLSAYDPELRKKCGIYYTPRPMVSYMVQSVDELLRDDDFGMPAGLSDDGVVSISHQGQDESVPRTLILDPACGTGTFLYAVVDLIRERFMKRGEPAKWRLFVHERLLPRLYGFEILAAPYAVAHLKLGMQLAALDLPPEDRADWACEFHQDERLHVYLTNTLDKGARGAAMPFARFISTEADQAAAAKHDLPIMVILGNPPYSGKSQTPGTEVVSVARGHQYETREHGATVTKTARGHHGTSTGRVSVPTWIGGLLKDYYEVDGAPLGERKVWLQNDYVKFIRFAQWRIEQTGSGIVAFVTDNSYLDGATFRGMRQQLMQAFDSIYILNLHGSTRRRENTPEGSADGKVFDIQQGVSVAVFVRHEGADHKARMYYADIWGTTEEKFAWLDQHTVKSTVWRNLNPTAPYYLFVPTSGDSADHVESSGLDTIFPVSSTAIQTSRDGLVFGFDREEVLGHLSELADPAVSDAAIRDRYFGNRRGGKHEPGDTRSWNLPEARAHIRSEPNRASHLTHCLYRPFDDRVLFYASWMVDWPRSGVMQHVRNGDNLCLLVPRQVSSPIWRHAFVCRGLAEMCVISSATREQNHLLPLYLHDEDGETRANLDAGFVSRMTERLRLGFTPLGVGDMEATFGPEDVFHYMYAILYSSGYRSYYSDHLQRSFPIIPLCGDLILFRELAHLGAELTSLHLLESPKARKCSELRFYRGQGTNTVGSSHPKYVRPVTNAQVTEGHIEVNDTQYFEGVPEEVWSYHIGGYRVCEKWLKDRRGRALNLLEIDRYQEIIAVLSETIRLQRAIDEAIEAHGGWPLT